jgi:hypothetical protein
MSSDHRYLQKIISAKGCCSFIKKCGWSLKNRVLCARSISGVRGRTRQQGEGYYMWRVIICTVLTKKDIIWGSINVS